VRVVRYHIPLILKREAVAELLRLLDDMGMWIALYVRDEWTDLDYKAVKTDPRKFLWN